MNNFQTNMLLIIVMACVIVLFAMMVDLASGLYKARLRGEVRTSYGLKRTLSKFISYEGGMLIAAGVDLLIHMSRLPKLFGLGVIEGMPVVTCLVGVFLCVVEFISIRENADKKVKREMDNAAELLSKMLGSDTFKEAFKTAIEQENNNNCNGSSTTQQDN